MRNLDEAYEVLGVARDASPAEIRERLRVLQKLFHPDRVSGDPAVAREATRNLARVHEAFAALEAAGFPGPKAAASSKPPQPAPRQHRPPEQPQRAPAERAAPSRPRPASQLDGKWDEALASEIRGRAKSIGILAAVCAWVLVFVVLSSATRASPASLIAATFAAMVCAWATSRLVVRLHR